jgi:hypothetical protein
MEFLGLRESKTRSNSRDNCQVVTVLDAPALRFMGILKGGRSVGFLQLYVVSQPLSKPSRNPDLSLLLSVSCATCSALIRSMYSCRCG